MATHARQQYFADESSLSKEKREFSIAEEVQQKIDSIEEGAQVNTIETIKVNGAEVEPDENKAIDLTIPGVVDGLDSISSTDALSAKQGKVLYDYIQDVSHIGHFLALWDASTGLPVTNPEVSPYVYNTGDFYTVSNVAPSGGTNYRPDGTQYVIGQASTTVDTDSVAVNDFYFYDGTTWRHMKNSGAGSIAIDGSLSTTSTNPVENRVITNALNGKADAIDVNTKTFYLSSTSDLTNAQAAYDWYLSGKNPIIRISGYKYSFILEGNNSEPTYHLGFYGVDGEVYNGTSSSSIGINPRLELRHSSDTITSVVVISYNTNTLLTNVNYSTPYTPQYDGSPATKKYVDDNAGKTYIAGANIQISAQNVISATDTKYTAGTGISIDANNVISNTQTSAQWGNITGTLSNQTDLQTALDAKQDDMVILKYGISTWDDFITAYQKNGVVYCRASSNSNPASGSQTRLAFMAYVNNETTPTEVEFQYYRSRSSHSTADTVLDEVYVYKLTSSGTWTVTQRDTAAKPLAGTGIGLTYNASGMTIGADTSVLATKVDLNSKQDVLTVGTGIDITSNTVSTASNFGKSTTAAATVQKEVSIPGIKELHEGQVVHILPSVTSSVANSTLKVNNFTAYPMRYNNAAITTSTDSIVWPANIVTTFVFDGTYWQFVGHGLDSDTTYSNMSATEANTGTATSARTISASVLKGAVETHAPVQSVNGQTGAVTLTIPTVNNATLTIQKNGTNVQTFTANQSTNATANITVPTDTADLTNGAGYLTSSTGVTSVNGQTGAVTVNNDVRVFAVPSVNDDISDMITRLSAGKGVILHEIVSGTDAFYKVDYHDSTGVIYASLASDSVARFYTINYSYLDNTVTSKTSSTAGFFAPATAGTQGQVLTKTASGYEWANASGGFELAPNSPLTPKYRRYGTQAQYDALTQYYTEVAGDTVYFTI